MREGNGSEVIAEIYAQSYYKFIYGEAGAAQTLEQYGSGMTQSDIQNYIRHSNMKGRIVWTREDIWLFP